MKFSYKNQKTQKNTIAVLDGVRGIACLSVLTFHLNLIAFSDLHLWSFSLGPLISAVIMTGSAGVTLFFILSGFLLFLPYAKAMLFEKEWPSVKQFYLRRALRIFPGYYTALFVLIFLTQPQYLQVAHLPELGLFVSFLMDSLPLTYQKINGPFWTLAVEWQFYMLLPWLALGFRWLVGRVRMERRLYAVLACLLGLMAWGVLSRGFGLYFLENPSLQFPIPRSVLNVVIFFIYGASGKFLEDFSIGMLICLLYAYSQQAAQDHPLSRRIRSISYWLWGSGLVWLLLVSVWHLDDWFRSSIPFLDPIAVNFDLLGEIALSLGFGLCITALLFGPGELKALLEWRPLRWLGMISYSLYIWHLPILEYFKDWIKRTPGLSHIEQYALLWGCALLLVIPFSYIVHKLIESPWIQLATRLRTPKEVASPRPALSGEQEREITKKQW